MQERIKARHGQAHRHKQGTQSLADEYGPENYEEKMYEEKKEKSLARQKQEEKE